MKLLNFLFLLTFLACRPMSKNVTKLEPLMPLGPAPAFAKFIELEAIDLVEDMGPVATNNDEIAVFVHVLEYLGEQWRVVHQSSEGPIPFVKGTKSPLKFQPLNIEQQLQPNAYLILTLIEMDKDKNKPGLDNRQAIITEQLLKGLFTKDNNEKYRLDPRLGTDEVLDVRSFRLTELSQTPTWTVRFHGIDLFDQYDYRMSATLY